MLTEQTAGVNRYMEQKTIAAHIAELADFTNEDKHNFYDWYRKYRKKGGQLGTKIGNAFVCNDPEFYKMLRLYEKYKTSRLKKGTGKGRPHKIVYLK